MLLLERDQGWLLPEAILAAVEARRSRFPALARVDEVWIADTASFEDKGRYAAFSGALAGGGTEKFEFYDGEVLSEFKKGVYIPRAAPRDSA